MAFGRSSLLRKAGLLGSTLLAVIVAPFLLLIGLALLSPFTSGQVSPSCTDAASHLPPSRTVDIPGVGAGTLLASDANASVVVVANYGHTPFEATAYIVRTRDAAVVQRLRLTSDVVVATVSDGLVCLFNDKLGYVFRASNGEPLSSLFESDNYRGLYTAGGTRYLQMDAEISALGLDGGGFSHRDLHLAGIAYGCFFSPPVT